PLTGAIAASGLAILYRIMDYDQYTHGIDSENNAQYMRAKAARKGAHNNTVSGTVSGSVAQR
ncbi:hypothetical protein BGX26_006779, partial [Mortierella sp. AD094]